MKMLIAFHTKAPKPTVSGRERERKKIKTTKNYNKMVTAKLHIYLLYSRTKTT